MRTPLRALCVLLMSLGLVAGCGSISPAPGPALAPATPAPTDPSAHPVSISVDAIGAQSSLTPLGIDPKTGEAIVPDVHHPQQGGWLQVAPKPGLLAPIVVLAHVDGDHHPGLFFKLHTLKPGAAVVINMSDGTSETFSISHVQQISKTKFPTEDVYDGTREQEIRLVTCGGALDTTIHSYKDSIIAYGVLVH